MWFANGTLSKSPVSLDTGLIIEEHNKKRTQSLAALDRGHVDDTW